MNSTANWNSTLSSEVSEKRVTFDNTDLGPSEIYKPTEEM